jgi:hypothetical protein
MDQRVENGPINPWFERGLEASSNDFDRRQKACEIWADAHGLTTLKAFLPRVENGSFDPAGKRTDFILLIL